MVPESFVPVLEPLALLLFLPISDKQSSMPLTLEVPLPVPHQYPRQLGLELSPVS